MLISQVFGALGQLECSSDVWEHVLFQSFDLLADSIDEPLAATVDFIFKAALHCLHLPEAVCIRFGYIYIYICMHPSTSVIF